MTTSATTTASCGKWGAVVTPERLFLALVLVAGITMRVLVYRSTLGDENSDEAIVGLMVRHATHGQLTAFLWGEAYGGTLEVLATVPVFWIFGSSLLALRAIPLLLDLASAYLVWRVGRRALGEPAARIAAAVYWIWPGWTAYEHVHQVGVYPADTFFTALILLLALRAKDAPSVVSVGLFGLVCGLGLYETFQILPIVVPAAVWLVWRERRSLRYAWAGAVMALVGSLPSLAWNLQHGWASLHLEAGANFSYVHRLHVFLVTALPEELGLRFVDSKDWIVPMPLGPVIYAGLAALFGYGAFRARRSDVMLVYLTVGAFPFLYALSPKAIVSSEPRYATVLAPCLALIVAHLVPTYRRALPVLAIALAVSAIFLVAANRYRVSHRPTEAPTPPRSLVPVIAALDRLRITRVFANYWLAYRLDFDTNERIVAVENGFDRLVARNGDVLPLRDPSVKWRRYENTVRSDRHAFVFFGRFLPPETELALLQRIGYRRSTVDGFVIFAPPANRP